MIQSVNANEEIRRVEQFIKEDPYRCPYFYTNLKKYGVMDGKTRLFVRLAEDHSILLAALLYYDCLHVYYKDPAQFDDELLQLIEELDPHTIFFPSYSDAGIRKLDGYEGEEVLIMAPQSFSDIDISMVKDATMDDIPKIAQFMYTHWNDIYDSPDSICKQVQERMADGYGRTKYIESDGEVVACVSSFAELDDFAVNGGLLVSGTQRGKKLGSVMLKSIYQELENEGKRTCGIIVTDYSRIFHEKNGFAVVATVVKYVKQ